MSIFKNAAKYVRDLGRAPEERSLSFQDVFGSGGDWTGGTRAKSGVTVSPDTALQLSAVYACVSLLSDTVASLPWDVVRKREGIRVVQDPRPAILDKPAVDRTAYEIKFQIVASLLLHGNAYVALLRNDAGTLVEMVVMDPKKVTPVRDEKTGQILFQVQGEPRPFTGYEILHIPYFLKPGEIIGLSPIQLAMEAVGLGLATEEYGARFFGQGATLSGVIQVPGEMTPEQAKIIRATWQDHHSGIKKSHLPGVLTAGATWQASSVPPEQAQFLETRKFQTSEIARLFRVPPHMIGDVEKTTSWGTGIEEQSIGFVTYTLGPILKRIEEAMTTLFPRPQWVQFDTKALLRGNTKARFESYAIGRNIGVYSPNEIRAWEDLAPREGGDEYQDVLQGAAPEEEKDKQDPDSGGAPAPEPEDEDTEEGRMALVDRLRDAEKVRLLEERLRLEESRSARLEADLERVKRGRRLVVKRDPETGLALEVEEVPEP